MQLFKFLIAVGIICGSQWLTAQETVDLAYFNEIVASGNVDLVLQEGQATKVELDANGIDDQHIKIHVNEGILKINTLKSLIRGNDRQVKVIVTYEKLYRVKAYAGARVIADGVLTTDKFVIQLNSGAQMDIEVATDNLEVVVSQGSELDISGQTNSFELRTSTGGICEAFGLLSDFAYVTSNTGGEAEVFAKKRIEINARTGGKVAYKGEPEETKISDSLTGEVERI